MWNVQHITQSIARAPGEVVGLAGDPSRLPEWAGGLSSGIRKRADDWVTDSPMGEVIVRLAPANDRPRAIAGCARGMSRRCARVSGFDRALAARMLRD